jgi:hypothetical protein
MGRYKALIGPRLRARCFAAQQTEAAIGVAVLNRMLAATGFRSLPMCYRIAVRGAEVILRFVPDVHQRQSAGDLTVEIM